MKEEPTMITITGEAWEIMVEHAKRSLPNECCGILLGIESDNVRLVKLAVPCRNAYEGEQCDRFQLDPKDQIAVERKSRELGLLLLGFFHSHINCDASFSQADMENSWPRYSHVVLSIQEDEFHHARAFTVNGDQTYVWQQQLKILPASVEHSQVS